MQEEIFAPASREDHRAFDETIDYAMPTPGPLVCTILARR